jgi:hypothetical protein
MLARSLASVRRTCQPALRSSESSTGLPERLPGLKKGLITPYREAGLIHVNTGAMARLN